MGMPAVVGTTIEGVLLMALLLPARTVLSAAVNAMMSAVVVVAVVAHLTLTAMEVTAVATAVVVVRLAG